MKMVSKFWVTALIFISFANLITSFSCGTGKYQPIAANIFISLDCPRRKPQFDSCCKTHDFCYDKQKGRSACDNAFCSCLKNAGRGTLCELDARKFCDWVKKYGGKAYKNAGKK